MRLDKYLADMSVGTRKAIRQMIKDGLVTVNGETARKPDQHISQEDCICVRGKAVSYERYVYYMLNKPAGVVCAASDARHRTVLDLIEDKSRKDLFPVGRLDIDTTGLLMICNDGELAHRLLSPARHVDKVYEAVVSGEIGAKEICMFAQGLAISEEWTCLPAKLKVLEGGLSMPDQAEDASRVSVTICEGKFHQIKRMFSKIDSQVLSLKRLSMGSLQLDDKLQPGQYRRLTREEIASLRIDAGLEKPES